MYLNFFSGGGLMRVLVPLSLPLQEVIHDFCGVMGINEVQCTAARINMIAAVRHSLQRRGIGSRRDDEDASSKANIGDLMHGPREWDDVIAGAGVGIPTIAEDKVENRNECRMWYRYGDFDKCDDVEMDSNENKDRQRRNDKENESNEEDGWNTPGVRYYRGSQTVRDCGLRYPSDILDIIYTPLRKEVSGDNVLPFGLNQSPFY